MPYPYAELKHRDIRLTHNEAAALVHEGKYEDAAKKLHTLLSMLPKRTSAFYVNTARYLAEVLGFLGRHVEAITVASDVVAAVESDLGKRHPIYWDATIALAEANGMARNHSAMATLLVPVVADMALRLGDRNVEFLLAKASLANAYGCMGNGEQHMVLLTEVMSGLEATLPPDDIRVVRTRGNLANAYGLVGRYEDELRLLLQVVASKRIQCKGRDKLELAKSLHNLALAYGHNGDYVTKLTTILECLKIKEEYLPATHVDHVISLKSLGETHIALSVGDPGHHHLILGLDALTKAKNILEQQLDRSIYLDGIDRLARRISQLHVPVAPTDES